jgi:uncharacterized protein (TIGR03083 family)
MSVTSMTKDPATRTLRITAQFSAPAERVWELFADPRQLEQWWGPPACPATVVDHDLSPGGRVTYSMALPDGTSSKGWWLVRRVEPPTLLEFDDGFSNEDGSPNEDLPITSGRVTFEERDGVTSMFIETTFASDEQMEQLLAMGMEEGMAAALGQIEGVLDAQLQRHVVATFRALADLLEGSDAETWDAPSLCAGWRVRELVAHVTMAARYDAEQFTEMLAEVGFDFTKLSDRLALEDGQRRVPALVADLRSSALHAWTPPGGGWHGALNHAVIHALDVTVALDRPRCSDDDAMRIVLDDLTAGGVHAHFGVELPPATLRATDLDWSFGTGPEVAATAEVHALRLCGRPVG